MLTPTFIIKSEIFFQQDSLNPTEKSRETGSILTSVKARARNNPEKTLVGGYAAILPNSLPFFHLNIMFDNASYFYEVKIKENKSDGIIVTFYKNTVVTIL